MRRRRVDAANFDLDAPGWKRRNSVAAAGAGLSAAAPSSHLEIFLVDAGNAEKPAPMIFSLIEH